MPSQEIVDCILAPTNRSRNRTNACTIAPQSQHLLTFGVHNRMVVVILATPWSADRLPGLYLGSECVANGLAYLVLDLRVFGRVGAALPVSSERSPKLGRLHSNPPRSLRGRRVPVRPSADRTRPRSHSLRDTSRSNADIVVYRTSETLLGLLPQPSAMRTGRGLLPHPARSCLASWHGQRFLL